MEWKSKKDRKYIGKVGCKMEAETRQLIRQMQFHKVIGELQALESTYYDPMKGATDEYKEISNVIGHIISELKDYIG